MLWLARALYTANSKENKSKIYVYGDRRSFVCGWCIQTYTLRLVEIP